jgi:hypothetical protein
MTAQAAAWLAAFPGAALLRGSGTLYLFVNAAHILGIGLLVGAILPLDLRLLGFFRDVPLAVLGPFLSRAARGGLALALVTGFLLLTVRPGDYLGNPAFLAKLALLALALANIALQHANPHFGTALAGGPVHAGVRAAAAASALLWVAVLVAGRWIGFV